LGVLLAKKTTEETANLEKLQQVFESLEKISQEVLIALKKEDQALNETSMASSHIAKIASELKIISENIQSNFDRFEV